MASEKFMDVKVTFIETTVVETDAANFMSVVQKLTGKEVTKANIIPPTQVAPQAYGAKLTSTALSKPEASNAYGGFEVEAAGAEDVVDEVVAWMMELEPHLDDLYELVNL